MDKEKPKGAWKT